MTGGCPLPAPSEACGMTGIEGMIEIEGMRGTGDTTDHLHAMTEGGTGEG